MFSRLRIVKYLLKSIWNITITKEIFLILICITIFIYYYIIQSKILIFHCENTNLVIILYYDLLIVYKCRNTGINVLVCYIIWYLHETIPDDVKICIYIYVLIVFVKSFHYFVKTKVWRCLVFYITHYLFYFRNDLARLFNQNILTCFF